MDTSVAYTADCVPPKPIHTSLYRLDESLDWLMAVSYTHLFLGPFPFEVLYLLVHIHQTMPDGGQVSRIFPMQGIA